MNPADRWFLGEDVRCGNCIVWNGLPGDAEGGCAVLMVPRAADAEPCRRWYPLDELHRPLYGRKEA